MRVTEVAELLRVSRRCVCYWMASGLLPRVKFTRCCVRVRRVDVERLIMKSRTAVESTVDVAAACDDASVPA